MLLEWLENWETKLENLAVETSLERVLLETFIKIISCCRKTVKEQKTTVK